MKKLLFLLLTAVPLCAAAQKSYWQIEETRPVMVTSLFFDAFLDEFTPLDHLTFDPATGRIAYYNGYIKTLEPAPFSDEGSPREWKITPRIVDGKLKVLIYGSNDNIGFLICKKIADNEAAFMDKVKASKSFVSNALMEAIKEHPSVDLDQGAVAGDAVMVSLGDYSLSLPANKYFITGDSRTGYRFLLRSDKEWASDFKVLHSENNMNDSLDAQSFWPVARKGSLWLCASPYYDWRKKKKGIGRYLLSNSMPVAGGFVNMVTAEKDSVAQLIAMLPLFRSLSTDKKGISPAAYNYPQRNIKGVDHKVGELAFTLPERYRMREFSYGGSNFYEFAVMDGLAFSSKDPNSSYYPVEELDKKGNTSLRLADGGFYALKNARLNTDIKKIRADFDRDGIRVMDQDESGILYHYHGSFVLLRYFRKKDTHYVYLMKFEDPDSCLLEFGRSKGMLL